MMERGHLDQTTIGTLRRVFAPLEARIDLHPSWRGADLERLLDADHAAIEEALARRIEGNDWQVLIEVTYSIYGERGSIDILALNAARRAALVAEVKSEIAAAEAVGRKLDEKRRLAAAIVHERVGWTPAIVGLVLVLPESPRLRRLLAGPAASLTRALPIASRAVAAWLRNPDRALAATWFLSVSTPRSVRRVRVDKQRPRSPNKPEARPDPSVDGAGNRRDATDPPLSAASKTTGNGGR
jgi:hypothetical protein